MAGWPAIDKTDWGNYISFATCLREKVERNGQDLLVIDTGDRVEGNVLHDSSEPKGVYLSEILRYQYIDVITSGNHELYKQNTSESKFRIPCPTSRRFRKFTTKQQGIRIIVFRFLFDFTGNYNNEIPEG
ncbi:hypothetical protein PDE_00384 [Penicillium oxalicum 114-2]|uniref:Calcineurin-like phosphoesterase domain-containing protein n=1 Tax=Penicillium oxalicum (strain 114-2 / CGMCC 5302) TaxID=933388 RepID=S7Z9V0_PENO1|nr:hypothetical protein PDE_00384 [Penicillium oxalicum 114-2]